MQHGRPITGPSLLPPLLSPFFFLSTYLPPFLLLFPPVFLYQLYYSLLFRPRFFFSFLLNRGLGDRRLTVKIHKIFDDSSWIEDGKSLRYDIIHGKKIYISTIRVKFISNRNIAAQTNSQLQREAVHPRRWLRLPSPSALPFYRRFSRTHGHGTCVSDTCARVPYPLVEVSPTRCVYATCSLYPASWFSTRKISSVSFAAVRPADPPIRRG